VEIAVTILFGLIIGSFLNAVIYRLPRKISIISPRSFCPHCQAKIPFYLNIPVLSFLILRGKCRNCGQPISWQYPLIELLTAGSFVLCLHFFSFTLYALSAMLFIALLICLAAIDLRHMILPDEITLAGAILFLLYGLINPNLTFLDCFLSAVISALIFLIIYFFYLKVRKIEGLGFGDIKMMLFLGAFLGHRKLVLAIFMASFSGLLVGLFFIIFRKKNLRMALPFGSFLSLGSYISLFWSDYLFSLFQSFIW
jgi:leader peptidase (prepilin peptidase)/N-methyltransferase